MSTTVEVAHAPHAELTVLISDEDFEVLGIETYELNDDDYGIAIGNQSGHCYVIHGSTYELQKFVARLMTMVRTIAHDDEDVIP